MEYSVDDPLPPPDPITDDDIADPLAWAKRSNYQLGSLAAVPYDRRRPLAFQPQPFLPYLWQRTGSSGRSRLGSLPALFCGMTDLTSDAICSYLSQRLVLVLGEYRTQAIDPDDPLPAANFEDLCEPQLYSLGYAFPASIPIVTSRDSQTNAMFIGYTFFQEAWRTPQQIVLMYLGLAFLFGEFRLVNIHGVRYADNRLTARLAGKFGFRDVGTIPNYMQREATGELADATISTLDRATFVDKLRDVLIGLQNQEGGSSSEG